VEATTAEVSDHNVTTLVLHEVVMVVDHLVVEAHTIVVVDLLAVVSKVVLHLVLPLRPTSQDHTITRR
jgi:hypothetical protein